MLSLTRSGVVDLIGKEWYFVRVHDAVQTCLQHLQSLSLNESSKSPEMDSDYKPHLHQRVRKQRADDFTSSELESGNRHVPTSKETNPNLEPLLPRKSWKEQISQILYFGMLYGAGNLCFAIIFTKDLGSIHSFV